MKNLKTLGKVGIPLLLIPTVAYFALKKKEKDYKNLQLHIVRHGQTTYNRDGIMQGQLNTELTDLGK